MKTKNRNRILCPNCGFDQDGAKHVTHCLSCSFPLYGAKTESELVSQAMAALGRRKSEAKSAASRRNGALSKIRDEFTELNLSRQRKWQLRKLRDAKKRLAIPRVA